MAVNTRLRHAALSDKGRRRSNNEDRYFVEQDIGVYAVIDGVGGHAAGERAADVAVEVIRERLHRQTGTPEQRLREAIALANNEIYRLSRTRPDWNGMACVLTIALVEDGVVNVGHVGDSRMYLLHNGTITKMTHDHSPVGEREDRGELTEVEAMHHARRNEIYRDVGASERSPDDQEFIEFRQFPMPPDGALVLCSDGLTDLIGSAEILAGVERYAPDLHRGVRELIEAANRAGGKDNVTVILVAGPEYAPVGAGQTDALEEENGGKSLGGQSKSLVFAGALLLGFVIAWGIGWLAPVIMARFVTVPRTLVVDHTTIASVLEKAHSGDTVLVPPATYREAIQLREGVTVRAQQVGTAILLGPVVAKNIASGAIEGVAVQGNLQTPLAAGIQVINASVTISNVKVTGAQTGIEVSGKSEPFIRSSQITNNLGAGISIADGARPKMEGNLIAGNGSGKPGIAKPGVEVRDPAKPFLKDNAIVDNAAEAVWVLGNGYAPRDFEENYFGSVPAKKAIRLMAAPAGLAALKPGNAQP